MITSQTSYNLDTSKIPAQRTFMESTVRELLYSGAFGAGKSRIGCEKGYYLSAKYPGNRGLVCRKTYTSLRDTTMDTWFRYVMPTEHQQIYLKQEHKVILKNGSEILFHGVDDYAKIGSLEVGWIFVDEVIEFTEEEWRMLLGRLRHPIVPFHQIFAATNPGDPYHWLHKHFYQEPELARNGTTLVVESNALQNPFTPDAYKKSLNTFKGRYKERFVEGKWISFEGLVYDRWNPSKHVLPRDSTNLGLTGDYNNPIPSDWERFRGIDFGFTNPFVCLWVASPKYRYEGPEGRQDRVEIPFDERVFFIYKEIYYSGRTASEHGEQIYNLSRNEKFRAGFSDWDAGDRKDLEKAGVPTIPAQKEISPGIQATYEIIATDRLYYLEDSLVEADPELGNANRPQSIVHEFPGYTRPKGKDGKYNPKEDPAKINDHGMDVIRYILYSLKFAYNVIGRMSSGTTTDQRAKTAAKAHPGSIVRWGGDGPRNFGGLDKGSWKRFN
jgi:hypothetical protein